MLTSAAIQKKAPTVCRGFKGWEKAQRESLGTPRIVQTRVAQSKKELRGAAIAFGYRLVLQHTLATCRTVRRAFPVVFVALSVARLFCLWAICPLALRPRPPLFPLKSEALMAKSASVMVVAGRIAHGDRGNEPYGGSYLGGSDACGLRTFAARADR